MGYLTPVGYNVPIDIDGRSQNLHHLYPGMGLKLGYLFFFFPDQNNRDLSGAYVLRSKGENKQA